jgi:hypothetical protein
MKIARRIVLFTLTFSLFAAADPFVGTWKLNAGQSKFEKGAPGFFFATMQIESAGSGLKSNASAADGEGISSDLTFSCQLDGTPCKVITSTSLRSASAVDTITMKRVDANTIMATGRRNNKLVYTDRRVVSADGKTMTVIRDGTTPAGKPYESTIILDRLP